MSTPSLIKQPSDDRIYTMDFAALLASSETINGVTSVTAEPTGISIDGVATFGGTMAQQRISGGTSGITYKVTFIVTTTEGNILEGEGFLVVRNT